MSPSAGAAGAVRFAFPEVTSRSKASASPGQVRTACTAVATSVHTCCGRGEGELGGEGGWRLASLSPRARVEIPPHNPFMPVFAESDLRRDRSE